MIETTSPIAIIGLGYVGLPLAMEFGKHRPVVGFDTNATRIEALQNGHDTTREVSAQELRRGHASDAEQQRRRSQSSDNLHRHRPHAH
jgi:UDP-N-acetyl-D-mannosaminuronate dehydrogenase